MEHEYDNQLGCIPLILACIPKLYDLTVIRLSGVLSHSIEVCAHKPSKRTVKRFHCSSNEKMKLW